VTQVARTPFSFSPVASDETLAELEFARALDLVAARAVSELGAAAIRERMPSTDVRAISGELERVSELVHHLDDQGQFRPAAVPDIAADVETLRFEGTIIEAEGLLRVAAAIQAMRENERLLLDRAAALPLANALAVGVPPRAVADRIERAIDQDGSVPDEASTQLASARRRVRDTRQRLVSLLERVARGVEGDSQVTLRDGRYVISIPRDARRNVRGLVHAQSASGASLFIEPHDAVELGNDLRIAENDETVAIAQVFRELSGLVREHVDAIEAGWQMSIQLDDLYARAVYASEVAATMPEVVVGGQAFHIHDGYHPLLREEAGAVPFSVVLEATGTLLVSGPNAGGKTVLLKAIGLIAALTQAGVIPPVGPGSAIPVFRTINVDIGDHQSIEQSLSTFSAHLEALKSILNECGAASLVLLDELGGGTDPVEGGALATAVLEGLQTRGAMTVATTHLSDLKEAAAGSTRMTNASLEFDTETLKPTYRLNIGKPGRSYGLAIAKRLGLPEDVVARAQEVVPDAIKTVDATLAELERREQELRERESTSEDLRVRLEADAVTMSDLEQRLTALRSDLDTRETELEKHGREQARKFLLESRRRVEDALALARAAVDEATAKQARRLVEEGVKDEGDAIEKLRAWVSGKGADRQPSIVRRPMSIDHRPSTLDDRRSTGMDAASEISIRGMRADEAEGVVVAAIDDAVVADLHRLRIVHGKGGGVLRRVVADLVRGDRRVARTVEPPPEQGGYGVTILEFR